MLVQTNFQKTVKNTGIQIRPWAAPNTITKNNLKKCPEDVCFSCRQDTHTYYCWKCTLWHKAASRYNASVVFQFTEGFELETNAQEVWVEKSKEKPIQMTRLIMAMESRLTFQKAIKPKGRIITEAIAKVAHKEHRGWGINNKETMNIATDATVTFEQCFLILQNTDQNIWKPGCIPLGELHTSRPCLGTGVTPVYYCLKKTYSWFEWRPGNKCLPVMM